MARSRLLHSTLARILSVVGAGSAISACGGNDSAPSSPSEGEGARAAGGAGGNVGAGGSVQLDSGAFGGSSARSGPCASRSSDGSDGSGIPGRECLAHVTARCADLGAAAPESPEAACGTEFDAAVYLWEYVCFAAPEDGGTCASSYEQECVGYAYACGLQTKSSVLCGPLPPAAGSGLESDACCYVLGNSCPIGRPFVVGGEARLALAAHGEGWRTKLTPDVLALDAETRAALAEVYRQDGLTEHASVASFARFVLQCLALGAPADIVAAAQRAGLEEVEHARLGFGLASAYSGGCERPLGIDVSGALDGNVDARAVALGVAREGCIAETVSALLLAAARDAAEDPTVRRVLSEVAEQELEHALLAWRYLRWALDQGDRDLHRALAEVFARPERSVGLGATTALEGCPRALRAHGCLPLSERGPIARDALRDVVVPAARALLGAPTESDSARDTVERAAPFV